MEREIQRFFSLSLEERHAGHLANPFAVPDDMDGWVSNRVGSHFPPPPSPNQMEHRVKWNMPPQPEYESFFEDAYESIMQARENPPESDNLELKLQLQQD
ncbi:MAG: hypothetical protein Q9180_006816, partial [Flavoplaca navasiana]